jgi:GNAT superfamily N-acetyltransferase/uncharacterized glyoxalase superfamily protein PhnB
MEPILAVPDVRATVAYYEEKLGFSGGWFWGEPPVHAGVSWDKVGLQFSLQESFVPTGAEFYIGVTEIEDIYQRHGSAGVEMLQALETKPWGMQEYLIQDLNGYRLRFGQPARQSSAGSERVSDIVIESRLPDLEDYERLVRAVGWTPFTNFETLPLALKAALHGVVALRNDEVIGCALLLGDNASFLYVKDVMVHPNYQGQGVGSRLMENLMAWVESHVPDRVLVGLYTGSSLTGFYEKFGFSGPETLVGMTRIIRRKED